MKEQIQIERPITVTSPLLPPLDEFMSSLQEIWDAKWITNNGAFHQRLEKVLAEYLGVEYISLFTNGTLPLITALQALKISGEVITTPYSFVATSHAIWWNGLTPVFVDVDPVTGNIDPDKIEAAITPKTTAIMPVHVYGTPCDTKRIQEIANRYHLKVIYDAAHAFGVTVDGESVLNAGDISTLSFHATKTYNTIEGGALICHSAEMKMKIDNLRNFGILDETHVSEPGINSKMDEVRAAYGLINLKYVDKAIAIRQEIANRYREGLKDVEGISYLEDIPNVHHNYSYFPIFIDAASYRMSRDDLYYKLKEQKVLSRRYFYPLISEFEPYRTYPSAQSSNLPVAKRLADTVLCLPIHDALSMEEVDFILYQIRNR